MSASKQQLCATSQEESSTGSVGSGKDDIRKNSLMSQDRLQSSADLPQEIATDDASRPMKVKDSTLSTCHDERIDVMLTNKDVWANFAALGTEMVVNKSGRRMFPFISVRFENLHPEREYLLALEIEPVDGYKYRFIFPKSAWVVCGEAPRHPAKRYFVHPKSPMLGSALVRQGISLDCVKITNNKDDPKNQIVLNSMQKYRPRVHVVEKPNDWTIEKAFQLRPDLMPSHSATFPNTEFIAVTAYHNVAMTQLKIAYNPLAKGFRDQSQRQKRSAILGEKGCKPTNPMSSPSPKKPLPSPVAPGVYEGLRTGFQRTNPISPLFSPARSAEREILPPGMRSALPTDSHLECNPYMFPVVPYLGNVHCEMLPYPVLKGQPFHLPRALSYPPTYGHVAFLQRTHDPLGYGLRPPNGIHPTTPYYPLSSFPIESGHLPHARCYPQLTENSLIPEDREERDKIFQKIQYVASRANNGGKDEQKSLSTQPENESLLHT